MQEPIQDGGGAGNIADQLAPVFLRTIAGHHRRPEFVPAHDDLEQVLTGSLWQLLHPHVIDDQQIRLEVSLQDAIVPLHRLVMEKVANRIEDRSVVHREARSDGRDANRLAEMTLARSRRTEPQNVALVTNEVACRQIEDAILLDRCIESEIERVNDEFVSGRRSWRSS